jgi:hypothetical protein
VPRTLANRALATTFTQATGFTTAADTTGPAISAIAETGVGSTVATIGWTTDETADSQVFFRKQGTTAYQQTTLDATLVTTHSVALTGLSPSTTYDYYIESSGFRGEHDPVRGGHLRDLVEHVHLPAHGGGGGHARSTGPLGERDGRLRQLLRRRSARNADRSATSPAGTATFGVNIPTSGTWYLWVRMYGPDANSDTWYESVNGASRQTVVAAPHGVWTWKAGRSYTLSTGLASIELGGRDATGRVDRVLITNDPTFVPSEQPVGDQTPPGAVTAFAGAGGTNQITLSWTNPSSSDFTQTIVRVRTDGKFPTSPLDGTAVTVEANTPGSSDTFTHTGLSSGVTYYYSAFSIDSSGNVGARATLQAVASDTTAPAAVNNLRRTDKH